MNELEKRAQAHSKKKNGLSPFCSLSEEKDMTTFVKSVTSGDNLIQYVADRIDVIDGKYYLIGFKSDMNEIKFLLGTPGEKSSYYNVRHLLKSPYWHISLSLKEKLTELYLSKKFNEAKKKKKPFDSINNNAGNVEHNIEMFNKMNSPAEGPCTNPVSGPFGGDVGDGEAMVESFIDDHAKQKSVDLLTRLNSLESCKGVSKVPYELAIEYKSVLNEFPVGTVLKLKIDAGEETYTKTDSEFWKHYRAPWGDTKVIYVFDLARWFAGRKYISRSSIEYSQNELDEAASKKETIELEYKDLEFTQYGNQRDADDWDEWDRCVDWTYEVDKDDIYRFIFESCIDETDFPEAFEDEFDPNNPEHWARFESWLDNNFDAIYSKYEDKILENWKEDAAEQAAQEYDPDNYVDWDSMPGGHDDRYWEDLKEGEEVFMEKYSMGPSEEYKQEPRMIDYFEQMNKEDDFSETEQEFSSAATSINGSKLPAIFKLVDFHANTLNLDYGGGKFDNATEYLKTMGVTNLIYDKFNRTAQHNQEVIRAVRENGGADTCTLSNVLNVIKEESIRHEILVNIHKLLKSDGILYITVFEGQPGQKEGPTKSGYQLARKTSEYIDEVANVFGEDKVTRRGKLIVARK